MKINSLYCIDNVKGLAQLPDNFIDLTVTSPPYDNLRAYNGFIFDFEAVVKELFRTTKMGGVVVWVVGDATIRGSETGTSFRQALFFKECGFKLHDTMIYKRWSGPLTHNRYEQEFEYMFIFTKGKLKVFNPIMIECKQGGEDWVRRNGGGSSFHDERTRRFRKRLNVRVIKKERIKGNIWDMPNSSQKKEHYNHPAPFPEQLAHDHIVSWSNVGDLVFDPFIGSGTTAKMAKLLKRNYLGFDTSQEYIDIANRRVDEVKAGNTDE